MSLYNLSVQRPQFYWCLTFFFLKGYKAYIGYLYVQAAHRNPILRVFSQILCDETRKVCQFLQTTLNKQCLVILSNPYTCKLCCEYTTIFGKTAWSCQFKWHCIALTFTYHFNNERFKKLYDIETLTNSILLFFKFYISQTTGYFFLGLDTAQKWKCSAKARSRWFLACTLIRNPQLASKRKSYIQALRQVKYANHGDVKIEIPPSGNNNSGSM